MLNAINTKLLIAILAALSGIAALLIHQQHETQRAANDAAKAAAIMQQQEQESNDFAAKVEAQKRKKSVMPGHQSKTWQTYVP